MVKMKGPFFTAYYFDNTTSSGYLTAWLDSNLFSRVRAKTKSLAKPYVSGVLAFWILLLSLAGMSPSLHDYMHGHCEAHTSSTGADETSHQTTDGSNHFCGVTLLNIGVLLSVLFATPQVISQLCGWRLCLDLTSDAKCASFSYQARAPPFESIV